MKVSIRKMLLSLVVLGLFASINLPANAGSYNSFDENIVRAYKTVKIDTIKPNLYFEQGITDEAMDSALTDYLVKNQYFSKKLKNKPGIFLLDLKTVSKNNKGEEGNYIKVNKLYNIKNPERFMFALNSKLTKKELTDREAISKDINDDASIYAILSEKIDKKNSPILLKTVSLGYNGTMEGIILVPKFGFGYIINPVFGWLKTDTASDIYRNISKELEQVSTGDKDQLKVKYYHK